MRYLRLLLPLFLAACGPSQEEIDNTATITCNIMGESRNMDAAMRIKEINSAREAIGAQPYLDGDSTIKKSFKYGLCEALVKNSPTFPDDLNSAAAKSFAICKQKNLVLQEKCIDGATDAESESQAAQCVAESLGRLASCAEDDTFDRAFEVALSEQEIQEIRSAEGLESPEIEEQKRKARRDAREEKKAEALARQKAAKARWREAIEDRVPMPVIKGAWVKIGEISGEPHLMLRVEKTCREGLQDSITLTFKPPLDFLGELSFKNHSGYCPGYEKENGDVEWLKIGEKGLTASRLSEIRVSIEQNLDTENNYYGVPLARYIKSAKLERMPFGDECGSRDPYNYDLDEFAPEKFPPLTCKSKFGQPVAVLGKVSPGNLPTFTR